MTTPLIPHATARAELLPCPFCGSGDIRIYLNAPSSDTRPWNHVTCLSCGTGHSSVARWNSRADSAEITALRGRVERLEGALRWIAEQGPNYGPDGTYKTWKHWSELARLALQGQEGGDGK